MVEVFIKVGVDIYWREEKKMFFMVVCLKRYLDVVKLFIKMGFDVYFKDG